MPRSKKEAHLLSVIMSLIMIYVMAALNNDVKEGAFLAESWLIALKRLPLGFLAGILCDLCLCTPLSRRIVQSVAKEGDREVYQVFILRFCMVIFMTVCMTVFGIVAGGEGAVDFFVYLPYNFTIALPIQMIVVAPFSLWLAQKITSAADAGKSAEACTQRR